MPNEESWRVRAKARLLDCSKEAWLLRLFSALFWIFLFATLAHLFFLIVVPTADEWPGEWSNERNPGFPDNFSFENLKKAVLRHLSLFPEHLSVSRFMDIINGAFITMFVYRMRLDVQKNEQGNPTQKKGIGEFGVSTYVKWAMGALFSGIILASSRIGSKVRILDKSIFLASIFVFSFVTYRYLYRLYRKLEVREQVTELTFKMERLSEQLAMGEISEKTYKEASKQLKDKMKRLKMAKNAHKK